MLDKVKVKKKQFLDSDNEKNERDWKIISNHFDNLTHLRVTACEVPKVGVQVRHENILKNVGTEDPDPIYQVTSFFIPGAQLQPVYDHEGNDIMFYEIGNINLMNLGQSKTV